MSTTGKTDALALRPAPPGERATGARPQSDRTSHSRRWLTHRLLLAADLVGLCFSFAVSQTLFAAEGRDTFEALAFLLALPVWIVTAKLYGLYDRDEERTGHSTVDDLAGVFHVLTVGVWLLYVVSWVTGAFSPNVPKVLVFWAVAIASVTAARAAARTIALRSPLYVQRTLIVGAGDIGQAVATKLQHHSEYGLDVVGFVDDSPRARHPGLSDDLAVLGSPSDIGSLVDEFDVERVIISFSNESHEHELAIMRDLTAREVQVDIVPRLFEMTGSRAILHSVEGIPLVGLPSLRLTRSWQFLKRGFDVLLSALGVVLISPLLVSIALAIKLTSRGPVLFKQVRIGHGDQPFEIYKFRTMVQDAEAQKSLVAHLNMHARAGGDSRMFKIPDDPRVTRVGRVLRRYSLDELPQLFNVLKGEMSLVGPRPLIPEEDRHISDWGRRRLDLKPGVTGPWQALGASSIPFEEMIRLDYLYITNWSLYGDVKWLWRTVPSLFRDRDAY